MPYTISNQLTNIYRVFARIPFCPQYRGIIGAILLCLTANAISGCSILSSDRDGTEQAARFATDHGWVPWRFQAGDFLLQGYHPASTGTGEVLAVYIEGDGAPWISPTTPPRDPTPIIPLTLRLAYQDPTQNRLYLGRPCQYLSPEQRTSCSSNYWMSLRYAPEVVTALSNAITQRKRATGAKRISLFGFSGGGGLAVLIAAERQDVVRIVTVAGNLDHVAWTQIHGDTPLNGSRSPADVANDVSHISQTHVTGEKDELMPSLVAKSYLNKVADKTHITVIDIADADHTCCWVNKWPDILADYIYPAGK